MTQIMINPSPPLLTLTHTNLAINISRICNIYLHTFIAMGKMFVWFVSSFDYFVDFFFWSILVS